MRRKLFLVLALTLITGLTGSLSAPRAEAAGGSCPICTTYADSSRCCVPCWCDGKGRIIACTDVYCPPPGGGD